MLRIILALCLLAQAVAECPNACSAHGKCGAYDMCICYRNWMANDCSERVCQFGLAHVDTPQGDLDASSGKLTGPGVNVITNDFMYPYGTTEQFPEMVDTAGNVLTNTAHAYRECSNKGMCDRTTGTCTCLPGYEGSACQRASCPVSSAGVCSGHGTCETIKTLAKWDYHNIYQLWDADSTMGCKCDGGYTGPDCSEKQCKVGYDPLYYDDFENVRYNNFTVQFYTMNDYAIIYGNYSIIFTDHYGEAWQTVPIDINANCKAITNALETLPNDVIPAGSVRCYKTETQLHTYQGAGLGQVSTDYKGVKVEQIYDSLMYIQNKFTLAFAGNPGKLPQIKINKYLDGARPTLYTLETTSTMGWHIYANGYTGEDTDYVNDECEGVTVTLAADFATHYLTGLTATTTKLLKKCLGDSNGVTSDNVEVYDWDYGTWMNPHLIKLVDATQDTWTEYLRADGTMYKIQDISQTQGVITGPVSKLCNNHNAWLHSTATISGYTWPITAPATTYQGVSGYTAEATTSNNEGIHGWCTAYDPPGFYAVLYFDDCTSTYTDGATTYQKTWSNSGGNSNFTKTNPENPVMGACSSTYPFRLLTRPATDYASTTKFHVYTTKGYLQQVNQHSVMYTTAASDLRTNQIASYHSNVVHLANATSSYSSAGHLGQIDCETTTLGVNGAMDCVSKGDMVMFLNLGARDATRCYAGTNALGVTYANMNTTTGAGFNYAEILDLACSYIPTPTSLAQNPLYPNIYTVQKISREANTASAHGAKDPQLNAGQHEKTRHQMVLDYGVNFKAIDLSSASTATGDTTNTIYKFHPPTNGGYNYVAECSNRGLCDSASGICTCFSGYTGDNCAMMNSLAK